MEINFPKVFFVKFLYSRWAYCNTHTHTWLLICWLHLLVH